jgi:hypothetical protein
VNTLLVDPPVAPSPEQPTASSPAASPEGGAGGPEAPTPAHGHACAYCDTPLREGQQWCLHCGACEPASLGERPNLRPLTVLALTAAILALGAAVAVAAAINEHGTPHSNTVALVPATPTTAVPATSTPAPAATTPSTGGTTSPHSSSKGSNLLFPPSSTTKPPKVTAPTPTPTAGGESKPSESSGSGSGSTTTPSKATTTSTAESKSKEGSSGKGEQPTPILLDTNAATTYNPYNYPESGFGDPALAIDGEPSTAWTAQVQPHSFPNLAEGLLIDLREPTKLGSIELRTPTHGMTLQLYGANGTKAPATITQPGWVQLSGSRKLKKTVTHLKLRTEGHAYRWLVVWIVKAPASAQGTPAAPGHVALSEVALYPPSP